MKSNLHDVCKSEIKSPWQVKPPQAGNHPKVSCAVLDSTQVAPLLT